MHPLIRFCTLIKFCILFIDYSQMKKARHSRAFFIWRWRTTGEACKAGSARTHTSRFIHRKVKTSPGADVDLRKCRFANRNNVCKRASALFLLPIAGYNRDQAVFLTICTKERKCILSRIVGTGVLDGPEIELTKYGPIADKYIHQLHDFYEDLSIESMPNHINIMLRVDGEENGPSRTPVPTV